jgi:hypothetical protein
MKKKSALIKVLLLYNFSETQEIFDVKIANNHLGFDSIERQVSREESWLCLHVLNQLMCFYELVCNFVEVHHFVN